VILNKTIMGDMDIGHKKIVISDTRCTPSLDGSAIDGDKLPEYIPITYFQAGRLARIFHVLRIIPERCELENPVVPANNGGTLDHYMGTDPGSPADLHFGPNDAKRTDLDTLTYLGFYIDNCA
jgi:hypothetical protein